MKYKTIKQYREAIESLKDEISYIRNSRNAPGYVELMQQVTAIQDKWREENSAGLKYLSEKLARIQNELEEIQKEKQLKVPEYVVDWFKTYISCIDWGYRKPYIRWISDNQAWVIVTCPGGTGGTGTAMGVGGYYGIPTSHWLARVGGAKYLSNKYMEIEGKLTKEALKKLQDWVSDKTNNQTEEIK